MVSKVIVVAKDRYIIEIDLYTIMLPSWFVLEYYVAEFICITLFVIIM